MFHICAYLSLLSLSLLISTLESSITFQTLSFLTVALSNVFPHIVNTWFGLTLALRPSLSTPAKCTTSSFPVNKRDSVYENHSITIIIFPILDIIHVWWNNNYFHIINSIGFIYKYSTFVFYMCLSIYPL